MYLILIFNIKGQTEENDGKGTPGKHYSLQKMQEGGVEKLWKYVDSIPKYLISEGTVENAGK